MGADAVNNGEVRLARGVSLARMYRPPGKFFQLSQLRKLRECEQVAAVCYRIHDSGIQFLLVRTNSGHWIFPKGSSEPGLTHAQAAALEAFEEAGVHGRIEEASFAQYVRRKSADKRNSTAKATQKGGAVSAHLCEVTRLEPPEEPDRDPTWFSPEKAKRRLRQDRSREFADQLARVVDLAVARILRLRMGSLRSTAP